MSLILKTLLSSLTAKKARTFLVLFSIAVSAALIFANECFSLTVTQRFHDASVRWAGSADFYVETKKAVGAEEWIDTGKLDAYDGQFEYRHEYIKQKALYAPSVDQMHYFTILGVDIADYNLQNPVALEQGSFDNWTGDKIIIGKTVADLYGLKAGDTMTMEFNGTPRDFTIAGVSQPKGLFLREKADGGYILAPRQMLSESFGGSCNLVFMKLKDRTDRIEVMQTLRQDLDQYDVQYGINDELIAAETQNYVLPFNVSSIVVIFMSVFIIFTAFNLITMERIPTVGTLRSIGCTRRRINRILLTESAAIGAVGGLIGCVLGVFVLLFIQKQYENVLPDTTVMFGAIQVAVTVLTSMVLTVASAVLPILRLTKTPIKSIILNDFARGARRQGKLWIVGLVLLALCAVVPKFLGGSFTSMMIAVSLITGGLIGLVPVVPFLTRLFSRLAEGLPFLGRSEKLGIRNIRDNRSLMNNIQLFSASLAIVAFMASMFNTMGSDLLAALERDNQFDVEVTLRHSDRQTLDKLKQVDGVESCEGYYLTHAPVGNYGIYMNMLIGIEDVAFFDTMPVGLLDENRESIASLNEGKNLITSNVMKDKLGLKLGDSLVLQLGSKDIPYKVTGFVETNLGIGQVGYISAENYRADMGVADYDYINVKAAGDPVQVSGNIKRAFTKDVITIQTKQEKTAANADKVQSMFAAIKSYSYLALLIGIIGIVNNLVASFIERKRSFALYRSIGMSRRSMNRMLVAEAVAMGVLGVLYGFACVFILSSAIPAAVGVLWGKVTVQLAWKEMVVMATAGILSMLAISAIPVVKSSQLSTIESIKYE